VLPPNQGLFGSLTAKIRLGNRTVRLISVHLAPFQLPGEGGVLGTLSALQAVEETHRAEIEFLLECLPKDIPVVIVGDLNSISTFAAPTTLVSHGLVDSFAAVNQDAETCPTWH
jgi:endonuclease/exonuclease/phosphatase family metal-dependent hydrolase